MTPTLHEPHRPSKYPAADKSENPPWSDPISGSKRKVQSFNISTRERKRPAEAKEKKGEKRIPAETASRLAGEDDRELLLGLREKEERLEREDCY